MKSAAPIAKDRGFGLVAARDTVGLATTSISTSIAHLPAKSVGDQDAPTSTATTTKEQG